MLEERVTHLETNEKAAWEIRALLLDLAKTAREDAVKHFNRAAESAMVRLALMAATIATSRLWTIAIVAASSARALLGLDPASISRFVLRHDRNWLELPRRSPHPTNGGGRERACDSASSSAAGRPTMKQSCGRDLFCRWRLLALEVSNAAMAESATWFLPFSALVPSLHLAKHVRQRMNFKFELVALSNGMRLAVGKCANVAHRGLQTHQSVCCQCRDQSLR